MHSLLGLSGKLPTLPTGLPTVFIGAMARRLAKALGCLVLLRWEPWKPWVGMQPCCKNPRLIYKAGRLAKGFGEEVRKAKTHQEQYKSKKGRKSTEDAVRFFEEARSLRERGDLEKALQPYRKASVAISKAAGKGSKDFARVCNDLAQTYFELGQHQRAAELFEESRLSFSVAVGEQHEEYAGCLQNLARAKLKLQHVADAEALYKEASQIYAMDLSANHVAYVQTLRSLASLYQSVGQVHMVQPLLLEEQRVKTLAAQMARSGS